MELQTRTEAGLSWNYLPIQLERDSMDRDCRAHILPIVRPAWNGCSVETRIFTEGITNVLLGFHMAGRNDDMVLLRLNGEGTDAFLDRRSEIVVMLSLHRAGLIPPVFLEVSNGLCYGYIPGRPFSVDDMQDETMMRRTASTVARLHAVPVPDTTRGPQLWTKIEVFMRNINGVYTDIRKSQRFQEIFGSISVLSEEIDALKVELQSGFPLVFCHNDLLCGNLIYNDVSGEVSMVDFEYGGANCAAYDIGNHFCEFAGKDPVGVREEDICTLYKVVNKYALVCGGGHWCLYAKCIGASKLIRGGLRSLNRGTTVPENGPNPWPTFSVAAHLFWTVWALLQAQLSTIHFDYVEYAGLRFAEYKKRKNLFLNL